MAGEKTLAEGGQTSLDIESADLTAQANKAEIAAPVSSQITQDASQADITNEDLFPGMNQKINVGSSSSQTLGTQPIFVAAGQYVPYNILNKKEEAIAAASKKRAERQAKFDPGKAGKLKNQLYQRDLNDKFNTMNSDFIRTAQTMNPENWDTMLSDPGSEIGKMYAQQKSNYDVLATESNVLFDRTAKVVANVEKGGPTQYSPETIKLAREVAGRTGDVIEGKSLEELRPFVDEFNGSFSLDKHIVDNKYLAQMKAEIASRLAPGGGGISVEQEKIYSDQLRQLAKSQTGPGGTYDGDNLITEDVYFNRVSALLGDQKTRTHKFKPTGGSVAAGKKVDLKVRTQDRYDIIKKVIQDIGSTESQGAIGGLVGSKFSGGVITGAKHSKSSDYDSLRDASSDLTKFYNTNKDLRVKGITGGLFGTNPKIESGEFKEELLAKFNASAANLGVDGEFKSVEVDEDNTNIINIVGVDGFLEKIDMSKEGALEDFFLGDKKAAVKDEDSIEVKYEDDGIIETKYLGIDPDKDPETFELMNTMLNVNLNEAEKINQGDLRKLKELDPSWGGTTTSSQNNQQAPTGGTTPATTTQSTTTYKPNDKSTGEMIDYESTSGLAGGKPHTNFGFNITDSSGKVIPVKSKQEAVAKFNELYGDRVKEYSNPTEQSKAGDFMFNTGTDPKIYELHNFALENDIDMGIPAEERQALKAAAKKDNGKYPKSITYKNSKGKTVTVKKPGEKIANLYKKHIASLSDQDRIDNLDSGRDWYYRNVNGGKDYLATHKGRLDLYGGRSQASIDKHEAAWGKFKGTQKYKTLFEKKATGIRKKHKGATDEQIEAFIKSKY